MINGLKQVNFPINDLKRANSLIDEFLQDVENDYTLLEQANKILEELIKLKEPANADS